MSESEELVAVGQILRPVGIKGEMQVRSLSDVPGRFQALKEVMLEAPSGRTMPATVTRVRETGSCYVIGVDAVSTPEEAAAFRGGLLKIPRQQVPPLPGDQYYEFELIGMTVTDESGRRLGVLEEILETGSNAVFVVRRDGQELLIPATREVIASVDVPGRIMRIRPLPGLLD